MDLPDAPMKSAACCFHANRIATILLVAQIVSAHRSRGCREVGVLTAVVLHSELLALLEVRSFGRSSSQARLGAWSKGSRSTRDQLRLAPNLAAGLGYLRF